MGISVCLIFRNNQDTIEKCLSSISNLADEIIAVNTGSEDNSLEIVKKYNAKVYDFKWNDNYSDAKNFAKSKATQEWIFFIDTDESISIQDIDKIKALTKENFLGFSLIQRNYTNEQGSFSWVSCFNDNYEESKIASGYSPRKMIRLFKNLPEIKFEEAIHESPELSILKIGKIKDSFIPIHHTGSLNKDLNKIRYYINIEKRNLKNDFFQDFQIASQLHSINELDEAIEWLRKSIEKNPSFEYSWLELGIILIKKNQLEEAKKALEKADSIQEHPMIYDHLGILHAKLGETKKAVDYFKKAIFLLPDNADFHFNLGYAYHNLEMSKEAYFEFKKAIQLNPEYAKIIQLN